MLEALSWSESMFCLSGVRSKTHQRHHRDVGQHQELASLVPAVPDRAESVKNKNLEESQDGMQGHLEGQGPCRVTTP